MLTGMWVEQPCCIHAPAHLQAHTQECAHAAQACTSKHACTTTAPTKALKLENTHRATPPDQPTNTHINSHKSTQQTHSTRARTHTDTFAWLNHKGSFRHHKEPIFSGGGWQLTRLAINVNFIFGLDSTPIAGVAVHPTGTTNSFPSMGSGEEMQRERKTGVSNVLS